MQEDGVRRAFVLVTWTEVSWESPDLCWGVCYFSPLSMCRCRDPGRPDVSRAGRNIPAQQTSEDHRQHTKEPCCFRDKPWLLNKPLSKHRFDSQFVRLWSWLLSLCIYLCFLFLFYLTTEQNFFCSAFYWSRKRAAETPETVEEESQQLKQHQHHPLDPVSDSSLTGHKNILKTFHQPCQSKFPRLMKTFECPSSSSSSSSSS